MVLLTSSAVSAAISASIVCTFTFLLFLSGYVLQQRTVRALQEALRNPPQKEWFPTPILPPQFRDDYNETQDEGNDSDVFSNVLGEKRSGSGKRVQTILVEDDEEEEVEPTPLELWHDYVVKAQANTYGFEGSVTTFDLPESQEVSPIIQSPQQRLAYIFAIPHSSDLCSAALFVRWHRQLSKLKKQPNIVFIYPAAWEISHSHTAAIDLIRDMQDNHDVICHPVSISRIWAGVSVESQLLSEIQHTRWTYDRAIYLRSPGMALDITALDRALSSSKLSTSWQGLTSKTTTSDPSLLLYVPEKGLQAPKGHMRNLTAFATTDTELQFDNERQVSEAKHTAYVIFDESDLRHGRRKKGLYGGLFERFERERERACARSATAILDDGTDSEDTADL